MSSAATVQRTRQTVRKDPAPRSLDPADTFIQLVNKDPALTYVWVNKTSQMVGVNYYRALGYSIVKFRPGEVCPVGNEDLKENDIIEYYDTILMAIPVDKKLARERAGQEQANQVEARMKQRGRVKDALRGMPLMGSSGQEIITEYNETSGELLGG